MPLDHKIRFSESDELCSLLTSFSISTNFAETMAMYFGTKPENRLPMNLHL